MTGAVLQTILGRTGTNEEFISLVEKIGVEPQFLKNCGSTPVF